MNESEYFEKNVFVHERDENENLLPVDVEVEIKKATKKIRVIPMTKGEIDGMRSRMIELKELAKTNKEEAKKKQEEDDKDLILKHIVNPKFEEKDIKFLKPKETIEINKAIMLASGFEKEEIDNLYKKLVESSMKEMGGNIPQ